MRELLETMAIMALGAAMMIAMAWCTIGFWAIGALYVLGYLP
jgi:hypothetical protein